MKKILLLLGIFAGLSSCENSKRFGQRVSEIHVLPHPKHFEKGTKQLRLSGNSKLCAPQWEVNILLMVFSSEIQKTTGFRLEHLAPAESHQADIIFEIDTSMHQEASIIEIDKTVSVKGGSYVALAGAKSTLLQLLEKQDNMLTFPCVKIEDYPDAAYRGLMIDLARQWHDVPTIKQLIDLAAFYKINFVQLHFTDYQSYTLPSKKYPKLSTENRHYNFDDLKELEAYSQMRGVTIIPEIDVPGHSSPFVQKYPEIFAIKDTLTNPWIINMGKEEVYQALDELIGEAVSVFKSTPYFHIGGDEAIFTKVNEDPNVQEYIKKYGIGDDVHELYRQFLVRINNIVKKHGKQMCVWEGFGPDGTIQIPKDIIVFEFETNKYLPNALVEDGYTVVNTSWKPLYVVNQKKWEPKTIYNWNMWRWENWWDKVPSFEPIQVDESPLVIGAQMCAWEQPQQAEIPSLRKRLPAFVERIWNTEEKIPYETLMNRMELLDKRLSLLIEDDRQDSLLIDYNFAKELDN